MRTSLRKRGCMQAKGFSACKYIDAVLKSEEERNGAVKEKTFFPVVALSTVMRKKTKKKTGSFQGPVDEAPKQYGRATLTDVSLHDKDASHITHTHARALRFYTFIQEI